MFFFLFCQIKFIIIIYYYVCPTRLATELCQREITKLTEAGLVEVGDDGKFISTTPGMLMARYCISFKTMSAFLQVINSSHLL